MLTAKKITAIDSVYFSAVDALYVKAFPWHEQREPAAKQQALRDPRYALEAWFDGELFIGLSGCWQFSGYSYIEHLAIDDTLRSRGYGKRLLAGILERAPLTILEIDPLTSDIAHKRLRFYETMAFAPVRGRILTRAIMPASPIMHCWCWATLRRLMKRSIGVLLRIYVRW